MLTATVSGSFHRHMSAISLAVQELTERGLKVLSPTDPRIVDASGDFLFVASDQVRSVRLVQDRHLECVRASHFLWLVAPDGYVGQSASMELGFAVASGTPIFGLRQPLDLTLRQYVRQVSRMEEAIKEAHSRTTHAGTFLIDPHASVESAAAALERINGALHKVRVDSSRIAERDVYAECERLTGLFSNPSGNRPLLQ